MNRSSMNTQTVAKKVDALDRVKFTQLTQTPNRNFEPNENHLYVLEFIYRHTMAASNIIYELVRERIGTKHPTNFYDFLRAMYDGELLERPMAQRYTEQPDGNFHVYKLTAKAERLLERLERYDDVVKHSAFFPHQLMGATYTATIDIMCRRTPGYRFIPAHEYLRDHAKKVQIPFEWDIDGQRVLIDDQRFTAFDPDYIFGIEYPDGSFLAFLPEFNRDTETYKPTTSYQRRSDQKTLRQMKTLIGAKKYRDLYDRSAPLRYIHVTTSWDNVNGFIARSEAELGKVSYITATAVPSFDSPFRPPRFPQYLFDEPMLCARGEPFTIKKPA